MSKKYSPNIMPREHIQTPKITQQQKLKAQHFWAKLELGDLCFLDIIEYGIALFGQSKAGKTTLAHFLLNNSLVSKFNSRSGTIGYEVDSESDRLAKALIGLGNESQTDIPNQCETTIEVQNKRIHLFDCPGYSDSGGPLMIIANGYFHYRIFSKVKNLKFVLTFDGDHFQTGKSFDKATHTITEFFSSFKDITKIKQSIFESTSFLFTKIQNQNVAVLLNGMRNSEKQKDTGISRLIAQLITNVLDKKRLFIFKRPERERARANSQNILISIHQSTQFWERNVKQGQKQVDMSQIKISIASKIAVGKSSFQQFQLLQHQFMNRFQLAMGASYASQPKGSNFKSIIIRFLNNSLTGKPQQKSFYTDFLQDFVKKHYIFDLLKQNAFYGKRVFQQNREKIKKCHLSFSNEFLQKTQIQWIQKLQISRLITQFLQDNHFPIEGFPRDVSFFSEFSNNLMKILVQLKRIKFYKNYSPENEKYVKDIQKFCYIMHRLFEQAKIFMIIFGGGKNESELSKLQLGIANVSPLVFNTMDFILNQIPQLQNAQKCKQKFQTAKIYYISNLFDIKKNENVFYYNQILKYCRQVNSKKSQFRTKMRQLRAAKLSLIDKDNKTQIRNQAINLIIQNIRHAISNLQQSHSEINSQIYISDMNDLGDFLCSQDNQSRRTSEQTKKALNYAVKIYKRVNLVHQVVLTYKKIIRFYDRQKLESKDLVELQKILAEFSQYAITHGRRELGIELLQHAYSLISKIPLSSSYTFQQRRVARKQLGEKIGFNGLRTSYNPSETYYDSLIMGRFGEIVQQKLLQQLQQSYPDS